MTRDNIERLALYARQEVEVRRIALNWDQVRQHNPPPSFVKDGDTRTSGYRERFGTDQCWELDALSPTLIADLIRTEIEQLIDWPKWRSAQASEKHRRGLLDTAAANWTKGRENAQQALIAGLHRLSTRPKTQTISNRCPDPFS